MSVMADTSHVPMAGVHAPTTEALRHMFTAATRLAFVMYTGIEYKYNMDISDDVRTLL